MPKRFEEEIKKLYALQKFVQQLVIDEFEPRSEFGEYQVELQLLEGNKKYPINLNDLLGGIETLLSKILVTGVPGSGGTSLLDEILYKWSNNNLFNNKYDLVFIVKSELLLGQWSEEYSIQNIIEYPLECFIHHSLKGAIELADIISALENSQDHRILFLIDDYHKIPVAGRQECIADVMNSIDARGDLIATVSSDNPMDAVRDYSEFNVCVLNKGYPIQVIYQYIKDYFSIKITMGVRDFDSEIDFDSTYYKVQQLLENNEQLVELVKNPTFLALLCMYSDNSELMNRFVESKFDIDIFLEHLFQDNKKFLVQAADVVESYSDYIDLQIASDAYVHDPLDTIEQRAYKVAEVIYNRCKDALSHKDYYIKDKNIVDSFIAKLAKSLVTVDSIYTDEMIDALSNYLISIRILDVNVNKELSLNPAAFYSGEIEHKIKSICNIDNLSRSISPYVSDHGYNEESGSDDSPDGCCVVSYCTEIIFDNILLNYPRLMQESSKMGVYNRLIDLGAEDKEVARCIIESVKEYNQNNPGSNGEKFVLDIIYGEEKTNPIPTTSMYDLSEILFSGSVAFKFLDTSVATLELFHIPTIENTKIFLRGVIHLQSMLQGNNAYLLGLSAIDVASLVAQGEIKEASIEAVTSIGYMLLPMAITFAPAEYAVAYSAVVVAYTGYKAVDNAYSFYQNYQTLEFQEESDLAYKDIFDNWSSFIEGYQLDYFYDYL